MERQLLADATATRTEAIATAEADPGVRQPRGLIFNPTRDRVRPYSRSGPCGRGTRCARNTEMNPGTRPTAGSTGPARIRGNVGVL